MCSSASALPLAFERFSPKIHVKFHTFSGILKHVVDPCDEKVIIISKEHIIRAEKEREIVFQFTVHIWILTSKYKYIFQMYLEVKKLLMFFL